MYVWYIGILYAKAFSGFFMDLNSLIQGEIVGTTKLKAQN